MATSKFHVHIEPLTKTNYDTWKVQAEAVLTKAGFFECISSTDDAKKDSLAKAELILIISPSELKLVKSCKTSKDVWETLKNAYESRGPARKATLLKKLLHLKLKNGENVRDHINTFVDLVDKLKDMEIEINVDLLTIMMLYSLPDSFENFRVAIETREKFPSLDELKIKIIEESEARERDTDTTDEACMKTREHSPDKWCLDSGCTSHMCKDKYKFKNLIPKEDMLHMATDKTETIKGKGQVKIQVGDDNVTLNDTLYIPELTVNLLSVAKATDKGCKVTFVGKGATVQNRSGKKIFNAIKQNGLYYIQTKKEEAHIAHESEIEKLLKKD